MDRSRLDASRGYKTLHSYVNAVLCKEKEKEEAEEDGEGDEGIIRILFMLLAVRCREI